MKKVINVCIFVIHVIKILDQDWSTLTDNLELETGSGNKQADGWSQNITFTTEQLATYSESTFVTEKTSMKPILTTIKTPQIYQAVYESNENTGIFSPVSDFDEIDSSNIEFTDAVLILLKTENDSDDHKYFTYIDPKHFAQLDKTTQNSMTTEKSSLFTVPTEASQIAMALETNDIEVTSMAHFDNLTTEETMTVPTTFTSNGDFDDQPFTIPVGDFDLLDDLVDLFPIDSLSCSSEFCNLTDWASHDEPSGTGDHERFRSVKIKTNYCFQSPTIISQV